MWSRAKTGRYIMKFDDEEVSRVLADPRHLLSFMPDAVPNNGGWRARCPVHEERTPSCRVSVRAGKARWRCFGCGAHGDVLDLLKALEGLSFGEALLRLGARPCEPVARPPTEDERMARVFVPLMPWDQVAEPTLFHCDCSSFRIDPSPMPARWVLRCYYMADLCGKCKRRSNSG